MLQGQTTIVVGVRCWYPRTVRG